MTDLDTLRAENARLAAELVTSERETARWVDKAAELAARATAAESSRATEREKVARLREALKADAADAKYWGAKFNQGLTGCCAHAACRNIMSRALCILAETAPADGGAADE